MTRYVYRFGGAAADGHGDQADLLGAKGAGLAEMSTLEIPVPPGFTLTTEVCNHFFSYERTYPSEVPGQVDAALEALAEHTGRVYGDPSRPLLLSVRPGPPVSVPGMMESVLNLGLNDDTVSGLVEQTGNARFAYDCYRRFVAMYGEMVMGVGAATKRQKSVFASILDDMLVKRGVTSEHDLEAEDMLELVRAYRVEILRATGEPFPDDPLGQLWGAISAGLRSWKNPRARSYRRNNGLSVGMGTAVNVQAMVFGNMGSESATGIAHTRDPETGEPRVVGEFLVGGQGEDVVLGAGAPELLDELAQRMPRVYAQLVGACERLEAHLRDMLLVEFTVEQGTLWLLETRSGKRTGQAMVRIAVDMVREERMSERDAVLSVVPERVSDLLRPSIDPDSRPEVLAQGVASAAGAAVGRVVFTAADAQMLAQRGDSVILVRTDVSADDLFGVKAATGVLTSRGGLTSHAAVMARGLGKGCVTSCSALQIDMARERFSVGEVIVKKGDTITIDGGTGDVFAGAAPLLPAAPPPEFETLMGWVDEFRRLKVRTNVDTPVGARTGRAFGAEGIGLCRTEHMFFEPTRITLLRRVLLADEQDERDAALADIELLQRADFLELFEVMDGLPMTVRLLDPPLSEFLPLTSSEIADMAREVGRRPDEIAAAVHAHREVNPALGRRGCRLGILHPEIYTVQARALAEAAVEAVRAGISVRPEIMVPFVSDAAELKILRAQILRVVGEVLSEAELDINFLVGAGIELPRACMIGDDIAAHADFFSFGTNDLTQATYGMSRDDAGRFLPAYLDRELLPFDPFAVLDRSGVGALIRIGVEKGRDKKTKLKIGICGEHGSDPNSVEFCHREGFDYVSCSPFRVPSVRVAAAQAALRREARSK
ncbi:pyruvate, phosphate dikinase [Haliangium ochraceum]|uniref:Pyruvate, phosphate dikinase n=1 Tax=Haliangium ochraceum (strain DSM 14365 / JCM 11303 / SMP-2) TaxID=502025 RepID=D0LV34_HALO1|nr:pyruvate, phosphate dikinase [Haliangium ochraceum]ACY15875.1 pyruvate, phosphate dikinase [Haliangium ochraceum DSM 14365]